MGGGRLSSPCRAGARRPQVTSAGSAVHAGRGYGGPSDISRVGGLAGQQHRDLQPSRGAAAGDHVTVMRDRDRADDRHAQPCARSRTRAPVQAAERLEELGREFLGDPGAAVAHREKSGVPAHPGGDLDPPAGRVVPDGVVDQVRYQPVEQDAVAGGGRGLQRGFHPQGPGPDGWCRAVVPAIDSGGISVLATQTSLLRTLGGSVARGTFLNAPTARYPAVVLGAVAAQTLGIARVPPGTQVSLAGQYFTVVGILRPVPLAPEIDEAALVGFPVANARLGLGGHPTEVYLRTEPDQVQAVDEVLPFT